MNFHGGLNGTVIFCSAFLLFAQYFISGQRQRIRESQLTLGTKAEELNAFMREKQANCEVFAEKLSLYDNLMSGGVEGFV